MTAGVIRLRLSRGPRTGRPTSWCASLRIAVPRAENHCHSCDPLPLACPATRIVAARVRMPSQDVADANAPNSGGQSVRTLAQAPASPDHISVQSSVTPDRSRVADRATPVQRTSAPWAKPARSRTKQDVVPRWTSAPTDLTSAANFSRRSFRAVLARSRSSRTACSLRLASVSWRCRSNQRRCSARSSSARMATVFERAAVTCATRTLASMRRTRSNLSDTAYSQTQGGRVVGIGLRQSARTQDMRSTCRRFPHVNSPVLGSGRRHPPAELFVPASSCWRTPWVHRSVETLKKTERAGDRDAASA